MTISIDAANVPNVATATPKTYALLDALLNPPTTSTTSTPGTNLHKRFRALFTLKNLNTPESVHIISKAFSDPSALLKHEVAYVLGQMRNTAAIPKLSEVLNDNNEDPMVRHEAAEALGAIADAEASLPLLRRYVEGGDLFDTAPRVVVETCILAIDRIAYEEARKNRPAASQTEDPSPYASVDPAPPLSATETKSTQELKTILLDPALPLFTRYRAMFALRNRGDEESVLALAEGFGDESALFRHEIAYVFGQLQHPASIPSLSTRLRNTAEESMVRHECAEALGSIATKDCMDLLEEYRKDADVVVRESCVVGLDMAEYENSAEFQFLDGVEVKA
ncbi:armadillo-type protein [Fimicolochytrium jonesii]|uniref:armadillo-type protein n=1 Tax=Fimicolochytrium jonesii TaxID=1396493 RepID=UPI0022FE696E|nr:armadillo-type protein [Fimicolochytrium jonesii]KAI8826869.1 armadillo-type protein [Fimicolochytrium jonesii]